MNCNETAIMNCELCSKSFSRLDSLNRHRQTVHTGRQSVSSISIDSQSAPESDSEIDSQSSDKDLECLDVKFLEYIKGLLTAANDNHVEIRKFGLTDAIATYEPDEPEECEPPNKRLKGAEANCSDESESESEVESEEPGSEDESEDFILDNDQISCVLAIINLLIDGKLFIDKNTLSHIVTSLIYPD